jgi:hypothetical protein
MEIRRSAGLEKSLVELCSVRRAVETIRYAPWSSL